MRVTLKTNSRYGCIK